MKFINILFLINIFSLYFILILSTCDPYEDFWCNWNFYQKLENRHQQEGFVRIFGNKNLSITELDDQLEDWAETLPEHLQEEFDIFWNQIWDIIDELREYASKVNVSDKAKPYVEKIIEILSNDNIKQDDMKPIAMKVMGSAPKAVLKEILSFIIEILDHVKPMIPKLVIPEMAHYFKNEDFLGLKKKLQNFE